MDLHTRKAYKAATLGVNAFNSSLNLNYNSTLTEAISLTYELRGGHDYRLFTAAEGDGLLWAPMRNRKRSPGRRRF